MFRQTDRPTQDKVRKQLSCLPHAGTEQCEVCLDKQNRQQTPSYRLQSTLTSVGSETTLSMIISGQRMFANKHVMIYKIYEKP